MNRLTPQQMTLIEGHLLKKFRKVVQVNSEGTGTPSWKNILFLLDLMGQGDFYGTTEFTILGPTVKDLRMTNRTFLVDPMYPYLEIGIDKNPTPNFPKDVESPGD